MAGKLGLASKGFFGNHRNLPSHELCPWYFSCPFYRRLLGGMPFAVRIHRIYYIFRIFFVHSWYMHLHVDKEGGKFHQLSTSVFICTHSHRAVWPPGGYISPSKMPMNTKMVFVWFYSAKLRTQPY